MAYKDGDDFVDGAILSYQEMVRIKNQWYAASAVTNIQNGMPFVSNVDGVPRVKALGQLSPYGTLPVTAKTANYDLTHDDCNSIFTMANAAARIFVLPGIPAAMVGKFYILGKLGAGQLTITPTAPDTINGIANVVNSIADELYSFICVRALTEDLWVIEWASNPFSWVLTA